NAVKRCSRSADLTLRVASRFAALCVVSVSLSVPACTPSTTTEAAPAKSNAAAAENGLKPEYDDTGRLTRLTFDRNGDGKIDTWGYMDGSRIVRVEVDEDGDGKVDRWEYHKDAASSGSNSASTATGGSSGSSGSPNPNGGGGDPTLERIDRATKHDGKISRREYFENGALTRVEEDTDGDGQIDKWETYSSGTLVSMAIDT